VRPTAPLPASVNLLRSSRLQGSLPNDQSGTMPRRVEPFEKARVPISVCEWSGPSGSTATPAQRPASESALDLDKFNSSIAELLAHAGGKGGGKGANCMVAGFTGTGR
jgi:hypothetical protein